MLYSLYTKKGKKHIFDVKIDDKDNLYLFIDYVLIKKYKNKKCLENYVLKNYDEILLNF